MAIVSQSELILQRREWKRNGKSVVCAAGAFDLLHPGHIRLLEQARGWEIFWWLRCKATRACGRAGCPNQSRGRHVKLRHARSAAARPITPATERAEILAALAAVDYVVEFDEPTPREFFARLAPDDCGEGRRGRLTGKRFPGRRGRDGSAVRQVVRAAARARLFNLPS